MIALQSLLSVYGISHDELNYGREDMTLCGEGDWKAWLSLVIISLRHTKPRYQYSIQYKQHILLEMKLATM
jgi:hypothetical protein